MTALDKLRGNFREVRVINFKNKLKHFCNSRQILFIEVWKLFLTEYWLNYMQNRTNYPEAGSHKALVSTVCLGCLNAIISLS